MVDAVDDAIGVDDVEARDATIGDPMTMVELSFVPAAEGEVVPSANAGGTKYERRSLIAANAEGLEVAAGRAADEGAGVGGEVEAGAGGGAGAGVGVEVGAGAGAGAEDEAAGAELTTAADEVEGLEDVDSEAGAGDSVVVEEVVDVDEAAGAASLGEGAPAAWAAVELEEGRDAVDEDAVDDDDAGTGVRSDDEEAFVTAELPAEVDGPASIVLVAGDALLPGGGATVPLPTCHTSVRPTFVMVPELENPGGTKPPQKICVPDAVNTAEFCEVKGTPGTPIVSG